MSDGSLPPPAAGPRRSSVRPLLRVAVVAGVLAVIVAVGLRLTAVPRGIASAQRALDTSDLPSAEMAWRGVLAVEPGRAEALYGLGWTLHLAGESDLARDAFQQCVDSNPEDPLGYKGLGSVAMATGNHALARRRFAEALDRAPGDPAIRHSLALLDLAGGRADEAVAAFGALVTEDGTRSAFRQGLAEALLAAGRPEDALEAADEAVRLAAADTRAQTLATFTRARAILAATSSRVDGADCVRTAPPVYAWLDEADRALDEAEATGVPLPELPATRRAIHTRRGAVDDLCPGVRAEPGVGRKFPGG